MHTQGGKNGEATIQGIFLVDIIGFYSLAGRPANNLFANLTRFCLLTHFHAVNLDYSCSFFGNDLFLQCDMLATGTVCNYGFIDYMERTGEEDESGTFPCTQSQALTITTHGDYDPDTAFASPTTEPPSTTTPSNTEEI